MAKEKSQTAHAGLLAFTNVCHSIDGRREMITFRVG